MILSDKHKFVYLANPKTGSSTLHALLAPYGWRSPIDTYANHLTADAARRNIRMMGDHKWKKYTKTCFVRNPWDRYAALWMYIDHWHKKHNLPLYGTFENYINSGGYEGQHQDEFLCHRDGSLAMDFVGKFEDIEKDTKKLFNVLKLPQPEIVMDYNQFGKKGVRKHYTEYYTEQWMIDVVAEREKVVIAMCGYKFGEDGDRWR